MIGFNRKHQKPAIPVNQVVQEAIDFSDVYHFLDPETTTYRLHHAINQLNNLEDLDNAINYAHLAHRSALLPSHLRRRDLSAYDYGQWLTNVSSNLGQAKLALKSSLRAPWRADYNWLGKSLAHSSILQNPQARHAYEQLAVTYRIQQHLLNQTNTAGSPAPDQTPTNKSGYVIERLMPNSAHIANKSSRLIDHYFSPTVS